MTLAHRDPRTGPEQAADGIDRASSAADGRGHRRAGDTQLRKRAQPEDEARAQDDVDGVRQPEHPHGDGCVAGAAEDRVDDEEHHDGGLAAQHHARVARSDPEHRRRCAHQREQAWREGDAQGAEENGATDAERDRLDRRPRRRFAVLLADAPRHDRGGPDAQAHRQGVDEREHRLGEPDGGDRVRAEPPDEEDVGDGEDALHRHLQHHGNGQQQDGAPDRAFGVVLLGPANRLADVGPEPAPLHRGSRGSDDVGGLCHPRILTSRRSLQHFRSSGRQTLFQPPDRERNRCSPQARSGPPAGGDIRLGARSFERSASFE